MICKRCEELETITKKSHYCSECFKIVRCEIRRKSYYKNKDKRNEVCREYKKRNKDKIKEYNRKYRNENSEVLALKRKEKRKENSDYLNLKSIEWRKNNKEKVREYNRKHTPLYRSKYPWLQACRNIINNTIKRLGTKKEGKTVDLLGYSAMELKEHIESKFTEGMTWDNYGEWHIDHIIPVSSFTENDSISFINSLENLQPLWAIDNLKKGKK
jgi:hypothetical protein